MSSASWGGSDAREAGRHRFVPDFRRSVDDKGEIPRQWSRPRGGARLALLRHMVRVVAALIVVLLAASPAAALSMRAGGYGGHGCCAHVESSCHDPAPRLRCCDDRPQRDPVTAPPQIAAPGSGRDLPASDVAAPPTPAPLVALIASRAFTTRQGLAIHAPPHLRLCVFLI